MTEFEMKQIEKMVGNLADHYKRRWPYRYSRTKLQRVLMLFSSYKPVRKILGGRWAQGEICWLWINDYFDKDLERQVLAIEDYR